MSTILKALRRLEEEKASAETGRPLREQIAASASRRPEPSGRGWLSAVLALVVSALAGGGLIWWLYGGERNAPTVEGEQVAAAPAPPTPLEASPPAATPRVPASPPEDAFASDVDVVPRPERVPRLADSDPVQPKPAPTAGARRPVEDSAAMARANAQAQAEIDRRAEMERVLAEAQAAPPPPVPVAREAAPPPSRREPAPVVATAEPTPEPAPASPPPKPAPVPRAQPDPEPKVVAVAPEPKPKVVAVAPEPKPAPAADSSFASLLVEKTTWHPIADRRSARLRVGAEGAPREVVEGDVVDGALVAEIQPSGVVFERDGASTRRGVGEK